LDAIRKSRCPAGEHQKFPRLFFGISRRDFLFQKIFRHATGSLDAEATYIPESARPTIYWKARLYIAIYLALIAACIGFQTILPLFYIGLPNFVGAWLMHVYAYTQHAGLAENVLDHRMNCRTVYMNPINRFFYWNMNYHVEHHMFPLVPYHNLPRLHEIVKPDMPTPYRGLFHAWSEIIPAVLRQVKDPGYYVKRNSPPPPCARWRTRRRRPWWQPARRIPRAGSRSLRLMLS
jgi:fatty acid desaturase